MEGLLPKSSGLRWEWLEVQLSTARRSHDFSDPPPSEDPDLSLQNYPRQRADREGCVPSQTLRRSGGYQDRAA